MTHLEYLSTQAPNDYIYSPLPSSNSLRLLSFTSLDVDNICCTLETFQLYGSNGTACPKYVTVSYVWGLDTNSHEIVIDGQTFYVRDNLLTSLRGLFGAQRRREFRERYGLLSDLTPSDQVYYWIDAICINQKNVEERNAQVQMMADIFSEASEMRAFITDVEENEFKALRSAASRAQVDGYWAVQSWWQRARQAIEEKDGMDHAHSSEVLGYQGLKALLASQYWTRTWIFQEFVLPCEVVLQCGKTKWGAHMLVEWLGNPNRQKRRKLAVQPVQSQKSLFAKKASVILCKHRWIKMSNGNRLARTINKLGDLLVGCQGHDCSERKDKVYGLLGLCHPAYQRELVVDYDLSLLDTFHGVLQCINKIETKGSTNMRTGAALYKELLAHIYGAYSLNSQLDACTTLKSDFVAEAYFRGLVVEHRILLPDDKISWDSRWDTAINAPMLRHRELAVNKDGLLSPQEFSPSLEKGRSLCSCGDFSIATQTCVRSGDQIWQFLNTEKALLVRKIARKYLILGGALFLKRKHSFFTENDSRLRESIEIGHVQRRSIKMNTEQLLEFSIWLQIPSFDEERAEDDQSEDDQSEDEQSEADQSKDDQSKHDQFELGRRGNLWARRVDCSNEAKHLNSSRERWNSYLEGVNSNMEGFNSIDLSYDTDDFMDD